MADENVTYRELLALLDLRDGRLSTNISNLAERLDVMDREGTRGLQKVADKLDAATKDLAEITQTRKEEKRLGISNGQWAFTTFLALCGTVLAFYNAMHGG